MRQWMQCEAEVFNGSRWTRCGETATDRHHMLTKARGGLLLDRVGETYHTTWLCRQDHELAHRDPEANLLIRGYVTWNRLTQRPEYHGTDPYLRSRYPRT